MKGEYIRVPIVDVQTPKEGFVCLLNRWWLVDNGHVLGYKLRLRSKERPSPQCNHTKAIVEHVLAQAPAQEVQFLPVTYWWPQEA